jgi:putative addiction module component (TIGR02574 family)
MSNDVELIKPQLKQLSAQDRAELAYFLISTLEPEEEGVDDAWDAEIAKRVAEIHAGIASGKPADEVFARLRVLYP